MKRFYVTMLLLSVATYAAAKNVTLCSSKEQTVFACRTGAKFVSVCTSRDLPSKKPLLRYVFGTPKAIEFSFPEMDGNPSDYFSSGVISYSGGSTFYLRFQNHGYEYVVYSNNGHTNERGGDPNSIRSWLNEGVAVARNDKVVASLPCHKSTPPISSWRNPLPDANIPNDQDIDRVENLLLHEWQ